MYKSISDITAGIFYAPNIPSWFNTKYTVRDVDTEWHTIIVYDRIMTDWIVETLAPGTWRYASTKDDQSKALVLYELSSEAYMWFSLKWDQL